MAYWGERLAKQNKAWKEAETSYRIPDGKYNVVVLDISIVEKKEKLMLKTATEITSADCNGRKHVFFSPMEGAGIGISKKVMMHCGIDVQNINLADIEDEIKKCVGEELLIQVKTKALESGTFVQNTNVLANLKNVQDTQEQDDTDVPF